jgi:Domain of unknown function (DUF4386)
VAAGVFFIVAAVAAIVAFALYGPVLNKPDYILSGPGGDAGIRLGAFLEAIVAVSVIGTGVTLFPIVRRQNEGVALAYVAGRVLEAVIIVIGAISLVSVLTLRHDAVGAAGPDAAALVAVGRSLVAVHDWTFLFGPGLAIGVNTLLLASLMYRSGLVPRFIAVLGLIGGPLIFASSTAVLFGVYPQVSALGGIAALPVTAWELSLAGWLIIRGFNRTRLMVSDASGSEATAYAPA